MWTEHTSLILTHQRQNQGALSECKDSPGSKFWAKGLRSDTLSQKQTFMCECRKIFIRWSFELSPSHSYKINRGYRRFTVHSPRYAIVVMLRASFRDNLIFQESSSGTLLPPGCLERQCAVWAGRKEGHSAVTLVPAALTVARLAPYTETEHTEADPLAL